MEYTELYGSTFDGIRVFSREWRPRAQSLRAAVCLIHGIGEHSGRYAGFAKEMSDQGFGVAAFDLRGHGRSSGKRGHTPSFEALLRDIDRALEQTTRRFSGAPLFLYGQSMGGNLALNYAIRRQPSIAGVIATSPWLRLAFEPSDYIVKLGRMMNRIFPSFSSSNRLDIKGISRDSNIVRSYHSDPLVHDRISARMYVSCYEAGEWALEHASECVIPVLLMHGTADRITSIEASQQFAERADQYCTFRMWKGFYHEIHHEPQHEEALSYMSSWMEMNLHPAQSQVH